MVVHHTRLPAFKELRANARVQHLQQQHCQLEGDTCDNTAVMTAMTVMTTFDTA
jgi:hypothetical protein